MSGLIVVGPDDHFGTVIERRLLVGDHFYLHDARLQSGLVSAGVTTIFDCMDEAESLSAWKKTSLVDPHSTFRVIPFRSSDDGGERPQLYADIIDVAGSVLSFPNQAIYVHCWAGMNRGPCAAYAILRGCMGYSAKEALAAVMAARPEATMAYTDCVERAIERLKERR